MGTRPWPAPARKPGAVLLRCSFARRPSGGCARPPRAQRPRGGRGQYPRSGDARGAHPEARGPRSQDHRPARGRDAAIVARDLDRGFRRRARSPLANRTAGQEQRRAADRGAKRPQGAHRGRYGLEGTLTDAISKLIIENAIIPRFRANDVPGGVIRGVDDIISVLTGDAEEWKQRAAKRPD